MLCAPGAATVSAGMRSATADTARFVSADRNRARGDISPGACRSQNLPDDQGADMLGLTPLGTIHTAISLIALFAGAVALWRSRQISTRGSLAGQIFVGGTILSCLTGFGIFQHGGFGNPH